MFARIAVCLPSELITTGKDEWVCHPDTRINKVAMLDEESVMYDFVFWVFCHGLSAFVGGVVGGAQDKAEQVEEYEL